MLVSGFQEIGAARLAVDSSFAPIPVAAQERNKVGPVRAMSSLVGVVSTAPTVKLSK